MPGLEDCADELLLDIAAALGASDLKSLALVARQFRGLAQEVLHSHITLSRTRKTEKLIKHYDPVLSILSIFRLATTLLQRPDLAEKVQTIRIYVPDLGNYCFDAWTAVQGNKILASMRARIGYWNLSTGWAPTWAGLIFAITTRLKHLHIYAESATSSFCKILESRDSLVQISTTLDCNQHMFLVSLPQIKLLEASVYHMRGNWPKVHNSQIETVRLNFFGYSYMWGVNVSEFLNCFPQLRVLRFNLKYRDAFAAWETHSGLALPENTIACFVFFRESLGFLHDRIEELSFDCGRGTDDPGLEFLEEHILFQQFSKLKRLALPVEALNLRNLNTMLPKNLEELYVYTPDYLFMERFEELAAQPLMYSSLKKLSLDIRGWWKIYDGHETASSRANFTYSLHSLIRAFEKTDLVIVILYNGDCGIERTPFREVEYIRVSRW